MRANKLYGRIARPLAYVSAALLVYGTVGVAINLRLLPLLFEGLRGWAGLRAAWDAPVAWPWLGSLQAHYDALPWLPWAAWLVGVALLSLSSPAARTTEGVEVASDADRQSRPRWLVPAILLALVLVAGYARMAELWPQSYGISRSPYDDEGVYAGASQLFLQGIMPYRDYFFAHPPIAALSYAPAMAYHFTQWGSPTSFMMARYLSVAYSLITLALIFLVGMRLSGLWGGTIAGALWSLDGRVVEINRKVMLDGPMVLFSCAALLIYLQVRPTLSDGVKTGSPKRPFLLLALAGGLAALSALTKIAGVACLVAIVADLVWLGLDNRRQPKASFPGLPTQLWGIGLGVLVTVLVVVGPFLVIAPSQIARDIFFFQLLRPSDGLIDVPARMADLSASLSNALTLIFAALGFILLTAWLWRWRVPGAWRVVVLWTFFSLLLFTYSRSFYSHYYIQLAAPLCLLGAGTSLLPGILRRRQTSERRFTSVLPVVASLAVLAIISLPLVGVEWRGLLSRDCPHCEDRIFEIVGRYVNNAVPPGAPVLTTDEQFNFLAARPPSRNATGYLIDSYGHMIFIGLGLGNRAWGDLWASALRGEHSNDAYAIMQRPAPQSDILDRASQAPLIVIHQKGFARLTTATLATIESKNHVAEKQYRYTIFRK